MDSEQQPPLLYPSPSHPTYSSSPAVYPEFNLMDNLKKAYQATNGNGGSFLLSEILLLCRVAVQGQCDI